MRYFLLLSLMLLGCQSPKQVIHRPAPFELIQNYCVTTGLCKAKDVTLQVSIINDLGGDAWDVFYIMQESQTTYHVRFTESESVKFTNTFTTVGEMIKIINYEKIPR